LAPYSGRSGQKAVTGGLDQARHRPRRQRVLVTAPYLPAALVDAAIVLHGEYGQGPDAVRTAADSATRATLALIAGRASLRS
jgi:hypothetical protein